MVDGTTAHQLGSSTVQWLDGRRHNCPTAQWFDGWQLMAQWLDGLTFWWIDGLTD
jgi:hypothetical protein